MQDRTSTAPDRAHETLSDAERVVLVENGKECTFLVLAVVEHEGQDYALACRDDSRDAVYAFTYATDTSGDPTLGVIADDDLYADVYHLFVDLVEGEDEEA